MDVKNILNIIHKADPEVYEKISPRRHILKSFGSKVAVAALPFALGAMFKKAYGKNTDLLYDGLAFALKLEYLEAAFYEKAATSLSSYPADAHASIRKLAADEAGHVKFLKEFLMSTAGVVPESPAFDFSGGKGSNKGPFYLVFEDYLTFLAVAQVLEDTGVRAYKSQMGRLALNNDIMQAALNLHSIEGRHAAHIRMMRRKFGHDVKPWITRDNSNLENNFVQPTYNGENEHVQAGFDITNINGFVINQDQATQAFDEPLEEAEVLRIIDPFIVS